MVGGGGGTLQVRHVSSRSLLPPACSLNDFVSFAFAFLCICLKSKVELDQDSWRKRWDSSTHYSQVTGCIDMLRKDSNLWKVLVFGCKMVNFKMGLRA